MAHEQLIKALEEETRRETERIIGEAEADADAIVREAEEDAEKGRLERLESLKKELDKERAAAINRARANARGRLLAERRKIIEGVFQKAQKKFQGLSKADYGELIKCLYKELKKDWQADNASKGNKPRVHINPSDTDLIKDPEVEFVPDDSVFLGVVFVSKDGRVRAENSFSSRLKKVRAGLIPELNRVLFG
jgi:vacuolar-type H+-ATPase subunit E/Vma4